jgi:parvulin-like peptidyl-prolyl isomerase
MLDELISETDVQEAVVACVNGETVTVSQMVRQMGVADNLGFFDSFARQVLIRQLAHREGLEVTADDLQQKVDEWRYQHRLEQVEDTEAYLAVQGITLEDVAESGAFKRLEYLLSVQVTESKIEPYFVQNKLDFDTAEVCWIFVRDEGVAEELFLQIAEEGADFYRLARQYSEDETTRPSSGFLGRLRRKQLPKGITSRVFASEVGTVIGPENVSGGYALYMLQQYYPAEWHANVQKEIRKRLFGQWLQREMRQAEITYPIREVISIILDKE